MKTRISPTKLIIGVCALLTFAATLGGVWLSVSASHAALTTPISATSAVAPGNRQTDLDIFSLDAERKVAGKVSSDFWQDSVAGYNIIRTFRTSTGETRVLALSGNTGGSQTFAVNSNGALGSTTSSSNAQKLLRCTGAEIVQVGGGRKLVTLDSFTGRIRKFAVADSGAIDLASATSNVVEDMKDKNLFSVYTVEVPPLQSFTFLIGVNTWSGETATYLYNLQKIADPLWTRGWTSIDHLSLSNVTYRMLYKAAGDPYKKPGESGDQARRFMIETVDAQGNTQEIQDKTLSSDGGDISSARFIQFPISRGGYGYGILLFKRTTAEYAIYEFDPQLGLGDKIDAGTLMVDPPGAAGLTAAPPYIDVADYVFNGKTFLAFLSPDNAKPLGYEQAEKIGQIMHDSLKNNTVGYQFMLAQSGRIFYSRGAGKLRLDHNSALDTPMTTRSQLNIGSVSKVITATTLAKLVEQGKLSLNDKVSKHLAFGQFKAASWPTWTPVLNLLAHTSGMSKDNPAGCSVDTGNLTADCSSFFAGKVDSDPECKFVSGVWNCNRSYNNSNTVAARKVIEHITGAVTSKDIVTQTRQLWTTASDLEAMTCKINPEAYYYGDCDGAGDCFQYAGKSWRRSHPVDSALWSSYCSSGGWYASSRELIEFLSSIRYLRSLDQTATNLLLNTELKDVDNDATAVGWDPPWNSDGEKNLNKGGYVPENGVAAKAFITRLPNNCDAALQLNSETDVAGTSLLRDAYDVAVLGATVLAKSGDYSAPVGYDSTTNTAINTVSTGPEESRHVVVSRSAGGNLRVRAFVAPRLAEVPSLEPIADATASNLTPALASDDVGISDGANFATVSMGFANQLNIIAWNLSGSILQQHASTTGTYASEVAVTKIASMGSITRIVTAIRNSDGKLQLDVWDISIVPLAPQFGSITHKGSSFIGGAGQATDIKSLGPLVDLTKPARFVTASHSSTFHLVAKTWQVDVNGNISMLDSASFDEFPVSSWDLRNKVALDTAGDGISKFFNGKGFMTTYIAGSLKLTVVTWSVDAQGMITFVDRIQTFGEVKNQAISSTTSIVALRDANEDLLKLIKWSVDNSGNITRTWDLTTNIRATSIAATNNLVGSFVPWVPGNTLRLVNWVVLNP